MWKSGENGLKFSRKRTYYPQDYSQHVHEPGSETGKQLGKMGTVKGFGGGESDFWKMIHQTRRQMQSPRMAGDPFQTSVSQST